ncbi:Rtt106-domain-containing protein [Lepidopterella palustris CBS 459.81]|uniref:Rtt106-domain-containing protein n=1 Tax=Lepidopterella palustris CBS 459.81 TaxID=1314670 RepID=A0A8E2E9L5_9PEZI|nr:Rtt106-domain-containing protein [Lepidopterella palustris CBS 459.81]
MHSPEIDLAFSASVELRKRVHDAIDEYPSHSLLFRDISAYILNHSNIQSTVVNGEPAAKKRKLENTEGAQNGAAAAKSISGTWADAAVQASWKCADTSFSLPLRKKLMLEMVTGGNGVKEGGIRAINPSTGTVEFGVAWRNVEQIFCLPLPEKAKRQHNFIVMPVHGDGVSPVPDSITPPDPIVWTFAEATGKDMQEGVDPGPMPIAKTINGLLAKQGLRKTVVFPDEKEFVSAIVQSHRKGEKAFHVKAFRGSKEGYLFFTSIGILWAFKKPLAYFSFDSINSISYTSVLQRTFNLNIGVSNSTDTLKLQEFEFSMIDQVDYAGIDAYIKKHQLQDASMAEQRKAKKLNINPPAAKVENGVGAAGEDDDEDGETELQKAERLLQDQEDEEEEDYDPGSDGESEGSGSSAEEDVGEGGYEEDEEGEEEVYEGDDAGDEDMEGDEEEY